MLVYPVDNFLYFVYKHTIPTRLFLSYLLTYIRLVGSLFLPSRLVALYMAFVNGQLGS